MSRYQNLASQLRPITFDGFIYNEPSVLVMKSMLLNSKIPPALLFSGVRGIGKTSLSRLFARSLNCSGRTDYNPCNECESCKMSLAGNHPDIIEISGSTNGNIEDIRRLMDQAMLSPIIGAYKVLNVDEMQGLGRSQASFDALLKVLEEPPPHIVWLFATTQKSRIPSTILSRLVSLDLRAVPTEVISDYLLKSFKKIVNPKDIKVGTLKQKGAKEVADIVAFSAKNSIRDALTLLEKILPYCNEKGWGKENALSALGSMESAKCFAILDCVVAQDSKCLWSEIEKILESGIDADVVFNDGIVEAISNLLLVSSGGQSLYTDQYLKYFQSIGPARTIYLADALARRTEQFNTSNNKKFMLQLISMEICM